MNYLTQDMNEKWKLHETLKILSSPCSMFHVVLLKSLIIHEGKKRKSTVKEVWICDPNYRRIRRTFALNFAKSY